MAKIEKADICVIGAGAAGLSVAAGAAQLGAKTVLIERGAMGGDCLNTGCIPSKSLLAAAHHASARCKAAQMGVHHGSTDIRFSEVMAHVRAVIRDIEPHDSVERFEGLGVRVIKGEARFLDNRSIEVGEMRIRARRFVIATGGRAALPDIAGLEDIPHLTNETLFELDVLPRHLLIIGGGPIAIEMGQAFKRLGAKVSIIEQLDILGKDDADAREIVIQSLRDDGVELYDHAQITGVARDESGIMLSFRKDARDHEIKGSHILLAAGRVPNIESLNLQVANIDAGPNGINVDARLRTSNKRVFAVGDVTGGYLFTHIAGYDAGIVIRNALFRLPAKANYKATPWVTYADPELAHVGLREDEARARYGDVRVVTSSFEDNDRARCEIQTNGFVKAVIHKSGKILGATIVGPHAGELIQIWVLAINKGLKVKDLTGYIAPYPTLGEITKRVAGDYYKDSLFSPRTRRLVKVLSYFG